MGYYNKAGRISQERKTEFVRLRREVWNASPVQGEVASGVSRKPDDGGLVAWIVAEACPQPLSQAYA